MSRKRELPGSAPPSSRCSSETGELDRILDGRGLVFDNPPPPAVQRRSRSTFRRPIGTRRNASAARGNGS